MPHLLKFPRKALKTLDGRSYIGQRSATFRFDIVDSVTGYRRELHPIIAGGAGIRHDTRNTIKRTITGLQLGRDDTLAFNSITSRLEPFMIIANEEFPLGRYVPCDYAKFVMTAGDQSVASFYDEMFIIDQQIPTAFGVQVTNGELVQGMLQRFLPQFPIDFTVEFSDFNSLGAWGAGTRGGFILDQLALDGDYLNPWFDNTAVLRFKRNFNPADELPTFDFDDNVNVLRANIISANNLIDLPNRYVVIGNGSDAFAGPVVGGADVPSSAPHSLANRGFLVTDVSSRQVRSNAQATAVAQALVLRQALIEETTLDTLPDPRHDGYDVVLWQEAKWLEVAWTLSFDVNTPMTHTIRRVYTND